ncbi:hypothetical protein [Candidatus Berkiella aquae]|uniref:Uncharacterized protein n=1 Tax=Candidatus Berkiella aquae TaxID=295108 RepID=A0A0Q9YKX3_9GAMM|nr:hypothetical protein [Candidatus Berkiella aquae]MCS5710918.1 hypothetical protein [Candidatus Berkiella aquae]
MLTGSSVTQHSNAFFTAEDALEKINSLIPDITEKDAKIGVRVLMLRKHILRDLNSAFTINFIKKQLINTIEMQKAKDLDNNKENLPHENIAINNAQPILHTAKITANKKEKLSAKANNNIKKFAELSGSNAKTGTRMNEFVMTLGLPDLPRRHPGADDSYHPEKDIDAEYLDLLERSNVTLKYIKNKKGGKPCPKLLFLRCKVDESDDPLTQQIHTGHTLADFASKILVETQYPAIFHFAGHGNAEKIGSMTQDKRFSPEQFAEHFTRIAENAGLLEKLQKPKYPVEFYFDVCNAAFTNATDADDENTIIEKVQNESVIGRFANAMQALGYTDFVVHGYRGFYTGMATKTSSGIRIIDSISEPSVDVAAENTQHSITVNHDAISVTLPKNEKFRTFPVTMLPTALAPEMTTTAPFL